MARKDQARTDASVAPATRTELDTRPWSDTAYLLALIRDDRVVGYSVFSERNPTHMGPGMWVEITQTRGPSFAEAVESLHALMSTPFPGAMLGPRSAEALRRLPHDRADGAVEAPILPTPEEMLDLWSTEQRDEFVVRNEQARTEGR